MSSEVKDASEKNAEKNQAESINAKVAEDIRGPQADLPKNVDYSNPKDSNVSTLPSLVISSDMLGNRDKGGSAVEEFSKIQDGKGTAVDKFEPVGDNKAGCIKRPEESTIIAGLISDKGNFGNQWDRDRIEKAVETALKEGKIDEFLERANNALALENMKLSLTYMFSTKSMPPTVHYSLNLDSADASTPRLDAMVVQYTAWQNRLNPPTRLGDNNVAQSELQIEPGDYSADRTDNLIEVSKDENDELNKSAEQLVSFIRESDGNIFGTFADRNQAQKILAKAMEDGSANDLVDKVNELLAEDYLHMDMSYKGSKPSCSGDGCVAPTIEEYAFQLYSTWDPTHIYDELRVNYVNEGRSK